MSERRIPIWTLIVVAAVVSVALLALVGYKAVVAAGDDGPTSVPTCSWPLRVHGSASREQAGLIRCYIRALATHDVAGLQAVADNDPPVRITAGQFTHAADARAGTATATFVPDQTDGADVTVKIAFANGTSDTVSVVLANPASAHSWRIQIGAISNPDTNVPAPAST
jgi:hypothetical protein